MEKMDANLFTFWTGDNPLPTVRAQSLQTLESSGLEVRLVTLENLGDYITKTELHPAFQHLNLAHRSDYLRAYFMHSYGGGYSDIKPLMASWLPTFRRVEEDSALMGAGYREIHRHGIANVHQSAELLGKPRPTILREWVRWRWLQANYRRVIGNCAFIMKPRSELTTIWWEEVNVRLDSLEPLLRQHPASEPKERMKERYGEKVSSYPVPWSYLMGDIFQPLALQFSGRLLRSLPRPNFDNYQ